MPYTDTSIDTTDTAVSTLTDRSATGAAADSAGFSILTGSAVTAISAGSAEVFPAAVSVAAAADVDAGADANDRIPPPLFIAAAIFAAPEATACCSR